MELKMFNAIVDKLTDHGTARDEAERLVKRVGLAAGYAGYTICDLKPLAHLLGCAPATSELMDAGRSLLESMVSHNRHIYTKVAQALNWERTEFDTLDELLEELRKWAEMYSDLARIRAEREAADPDGCEAFLVRHTTSGFADGGYVAEPPSGQVAAVLRPTHTLLHAGELYREVTILLHTEQLVAWRTVDGQEYSAQAHQVLIDPDEDGLAAAILSRIAGVEIAPEHMAELRAQMAGGVTHG